MCLCMLHTVQFLLHAHPTTCFIFILSFSDMQFQRYILKLQLELAFNFPTRSRILTAPLIGRTFCTRVWEQIQQCIWSCLILQQCWQWRNLLLEMDSSIRTGGIRLLPCHLFIACSTNINPRRMVDPDQILLTLRAVVCWQICLPAEATIIIRKSILAWSIPSEGLAVFSEELKSEGEKFSIRGQDSFEFSLWL